MDILDKIVDDFISEEIGKDVLELVHYLRKKQNVSEFKIAEHFNLTVNQIRNMLYRLYAHSLVDFTRKKDKKKGWYIYYWDFYLKRAFDAAMAHKEKRLEVLKDLLKKEETGQYFSCPDNDVRLGFEQAIEHGFKCPECDKVLVQDNNARKIQRITKTISELEEEVKNGKGIVVERKEKRVKKPKKEEKNKPKKTDTAKKPKPRNKINRNKNAAKKKLKK
ncbi:hypothetical protein HYV89_00380 [Candidatus Woesearchaeota archaeon]|nr:hypothetical protein [Candidatus Woesearchaeota archaeon]